jgi:hypothetical protein
VQAISRTLAKGVPAAAEAGIIAAVALVALAGAAWVAYRRRVGGLGSS